MSIDPTVKTTEALVALRPGADFSVKDNVILWNDSSQTQPSQSEIDAKIAEQNLDGELVKKDGYIRKRLNGYPSIQEQLDLQYWYQVNGTTKWKEAIAQVKSDNPKP